MSSSDKNISVYQSDSNATGSPGKEDQSDDIDPPRSSIGNCSSNDVSSVMNNKKASDAGWNEECVLS